MVTNVTTGKNRTKRRTKALAAAVMGKPSGQILERVKQAAPEHFGIVSVDCAKDRSKWMLADFYGRVLIPPPTVEHRRNEIQLAMLTLKLAIDKHGIKDTIVVVEMTFCRKGLCLVDPFCRKGRSPQGEPLWDAYPLHVAAWPCFRPRLVAGSGVAAKSCSVSRTYRNRRRHSSSVRFAWRFCEFTVGR